MIQDRRILFVEDNVVDQMAFKRMVKSNNLPYYYDLSDNVMDTLKLLEVSKYDIIITDYMLNDGTAFDFIPNVKDTPVIFITGAGTEELAIKAMRAGTYDYLIKDTKYKYLDILPISIENAINHHIAEVKLRESEERYRILVESATDMIYKCDVEGRFTFLNDVVPNVIGYSREELLNTTTFELVPEEYKQEVFDFYEKQFYKKDRSTYYEFPIKTKYDTIIWIGQSLQLLMSDDGHNYIIGFQAVARDITERREAEEKIKIQNKILEQQNEEITRVSKLLEKANVKLTDSNITLESKVKARTRQLQKAVVELSETNEELDLFVYRASHDLRGPLSRIRGVLQLIEQEKDVSAKENYFTILHDLAVNLDTMLTKLMEVNHIKGHKIEKTQINPFDLFEEITADFDALLESKNIIPEVQGDTSLLIYSDVYLLKHIFSNLIENAIAFSDSMKEQKTVLVSFEAIKTKVKISIKDNGIGIPPENSVKIFDMFYKGTTLSKGYGLGLYSSVKAAEKLKGSIACKSILGEGTTFTLTLPV